MFSSESIYNFRNYYVAYSNDFATKSSYSYTLYAHRLFLYILAKIPSFDGKESNRQEYIEVDLNHFISVYNLPPSGATYKKIRDALEMLYQTDVYEGHSFIAQPAQIKKTVFQVSITTELERHFYNLKSYVQFPLTSVMGFGSVYSFQIYASLLSRFNLAEYVAKKAGRSIIDYSEIFSYEPESILKMLSLDQPSYKIYKNLNSAVIKKAVNDINNYADLNIKYTGNNNKIMLTVRKKSSDEQLLSYSNLLQKFQ